MHYSLFLNIKSISNLDQWGTFNPAFNGPAPLWKINFYVFTLAEAPNYVNINRYLHSFLLTVKLIAIGNVLLVTTDTLILGYLILFHCFK